MARSVKAKRSAAMTRTAATSAGLLCTSTRGAVRDILLAHSIRAAMGTPNGIRTRGLHLERVRQRVQHRLRASKPVSPNLILWDSASTAIHQRPSALLSQLLSSRTTLKTSVDSSDLDDADGQSRTPCFLFMSMYQERPCSKQNAHASPHRWQTVASHATSVYGGVCRSKVKRFRVTFSYRCRLYELLRHPLHITHRCSETLSPSSDITGAPYCPYCPIGVIN